MEIYRNQPRTVTFRAPLPDGQYSVEVNSPEHTSLVQSVTPEHSEDFNSYVLNIPVDFRHTWFDGNVDFKITVQGGSPTTSHTYIERAVVVTPMFTWADLGGEYPEAKTPELERLVRHVIEAHTGQYFGKKADRAVVNASQTVIHFNVPLIEFTGISGRYMTNTTTLAPPKIPFEILDDGHTLAIDLENYDIKTDSLWVLNSRSPGTYIIEGSFGYEHVPHDVKEAALLIAGMWGCDQAVWRDRYLNVMRSADWSLGYHDAGFGHTTGSHAADNLLAKYSKRYIPAVI